MSPLTALLIDVAMTACWPLIGRLGMNYASGVLFGTAGLLIGAALMAPAVAARGRWRALFSRSTAPTLMAMGFFSGTATVIFISALGYTTPANAAIMAQVEVLYSALLCSYFLRERITARQAAASVLIVAGTGMIMLHDLTSPRWKGDLMIIATPWMFQISHMLSKRLPKSLEAVTISAGRVFYGLITMGPICLWLALRGARWSWEPRALLILLVQGVMMSCLNFLLWYKAIRGMDLSKATAIMLSYPALTVIFSWALGHETIAPVQVAGLALTLTGAYSVSRLVLKAQLHPETPGTDLIP